MSGFQLLLVVLGIAAIFALLALWMRSMMGKLRVLWAPNTALVKGTFSRFRVRLRGTYQDRPILAYLGNESGADEVGSKTYSYTLRMSVLPGFENWTMVCGAPRKGEPAVWNLKAKSGPAERLRAAGLIDVFVGAPANWRVRYRAGSGRLELSIAGVGTYFCPDLATFRAQLDLLLRLATITHAAAAGDLRRTA